MDEHKVAAAELLKKLEKYSPEDELAITFTNSEVLRRMNVGEWREGLNRIVNFVGTGEGADDALEDVEDFVFLLWGGPCILKETTVETFEEDNRRWNLGLFFLQDAIAKMEKRLSKYSEEQKLLISFINSPGYVKEINVGEWRRGLAELLLKGKELTWEMADRWLFEAAGGFYVVSEKEETFRKDRRSYLEQLDLETYGPPREGLKKGGRGYIDPQRKPFNPVLK